MIEIYTLEPDQLVIDYRTRKWCKLPYPGHPHGCPNYGKSPMCPPQVGKFEDIWDMTRRFYAIVCIFDMKSHMARMKSLHPQWSVRQQRCCLYWQNGVRKELKDGVNKKMGQILDTCSLLPHQDILNYTLIPEAQGMHVFATMRKVGVIIKAKPGDYVKKVAIVGWKK